MKKKLFHEWIMKGIEQLNSRSEKGRCYKLIHNIRKKCKPKNKLYKEERKERINSHKVEEV